MSLAKKKNFSIPSPLLTRKEAGEFLRISKWTLTKLKIPAVAIGGRHFYRKCDLEAFIEANRGR